MAKTGRSALRKGCVILNWGLVMLLVLSSLMLLYVAASGAELFWVGRLACHRIALSTSYMTPLFTYAHMVSSDTRLPKPTFVFRAGALLVSRSTERDETKDPCEVWVEYGFYIPYTVLFAVAVTYPAIAFGILLFRTQ